MRLANYQQTLLEEQDTEAQPEASSLKDREWTTEHFLEAKLGVFSTWNGVQSEDAGYILVSEALEACGGYSLIHKHTFLSRYVQKTHSSKNP
jgi:hypothetical protein